MALAEFTQQFLQMAAVTLLFMARDMALAQSTSPGDTPTRVEVIYGEVPSESVAIAVGVIYVIAGLILFFPVFRYKHFWGLCLPIGAVSSGIGFFVKAVMVSSASRQNSQGLIIAQNVIIVCAPATFFAFNYILYGHLVVECVGDQFSLLRPTWVSRIFVSSDVLTFIIQAGGAALLTDQDKFQTGKNIFLVGLCLQAASYYLFTFMLALMHYKVKKSGMTNGKELWWKTVWLLYFSSFFIIVRTVYRIVEGESSRGSAIRSNEAYFYCLDFLPLILAISVYMPWWPGKYLTRDSLVQKEPKKTLELTPIEVA
ncbi:hypothetical protein BDZ89DRAFT_1162384 [Hymenopellis radicata]|nr:hypothetical protein BDZ89DRAFT_1162384 [Hymenopellis radicata]